MKKIIISSFILLYLTLIQVNAEITDAFIGYKGVNIISSFNNQTYFHVIETVPCKITQSSPLPNARTITFQLDLYGKFIYEDGSKMFHVSIYQSNDVQEIRHKSSLKKINKIVLSDNNDSLFGITDGKNAEFLSYNGKKIVPKFNFKNQIDFLSIGEHYLIVAENSGNIHRFTHNGEYVYTFEFEKPILHLQVSDDFNSTNIVSTDGIYMINPNDETQFELVFPSTSIKSFIQNNINDIITFSDISGVYRISKLDKAKKEINHVTAITGKVLRTPHSSTIAVLTEKGSVEIFDGTYFAHIASIYENSYGQIIMVPSKIVPYYSKNSLDENSNSLKKSIQTNSYFLDTDACKAIEETLVNKFIPNKKPLKQRK